MTMKSNLKIVALAGGVGGAKLTHGLALNLPPENLTIIVNTGDDFEHYGLYISPDLDTVCYTLAGLANPETGWGRAGETWNAIQNTTNLGGPNWFKLGDHDLGTHLERTRRMREGQCLSDITRDFCKAWGIAPTVLPMSNQEVRTIVNTDEGELAFQEYFVHRRCEPHVKGFRFDGADTAEPAPGARQALESADAVILCPSNPWVSIDPILRILPKIEKPTFAVSPIIGGETVKGPAAKMYRELGIEPSALAVAKHYRELIRGFVLDEVDKQLDGEIMGLKIRTLVTNTLMKSHEDRSRLAQEILGFVGAHI